MQRILLIGSGHLAHALWEGWQRQPGQPRQWTILARSDAHRHLWSQEVWDQHVQRDYQGLEESYDVAFLAVKPKDASVAISAATSRIDASIWVSTMAGWTLADLRGAGLKGPLVRLMPNVCATVGASTTLAAWEGLSATQQDLIETLLGECGTVTRVDEKLMNPYTALLGSGPAYIFLLLEALIEGGRQMGVDTDKTRLLVSSMVEGAARLARVRPEDSLADWIGQVASPGGTTEALLEVLTHAHWPDVIQQALVAASDRAGMLGSS